MISEPFLLPPRAAYVRLARLLKMFYTPAIKCTITPTRARMVMEMSMMKAVDDKVITPADQRACTLTSGHSEATVKKFYALHDR